MKRVMLVGLGNLGSRVLDFLLLQPSPLQVIVGARDVERARVRGNLAIHTATHLGQDPRVEYVAMDVEDVRATARTLREWAPEVIFSSVVVQSWWVIRELPKPIFEELNKSQVGPWLPMHLLLIARLMEAVRESKIETTVVNASYPDVVHPVLKRVGLSPMIGIGNVANAIPALRRSMASRLGAAVGEIEVRLITQHYVSHRISACGEAGGAPYHLAVLRRGKDVSGELDLSHPFEDLAGVLRRPGGKAGTDITAASAMTVLRAVLGDTGEIVHAPGPNGLPGGYPVRVYADRCELALPAGLTEKDAVSINEQCMKFDGVERIDETGTAHFTVREREVLRRMLGYECESLRVEEAESRARELRRLYLEFAERCKAEAPAGVS